MAFSGGVKLGDLDDFISLSQDDLFFEDFEAVTPPLHICIVNLTHTRIITHASFWLMADSSQRN